jgi:hypothetical protein
MLEFVIAGIASITLMLSTVQIGMAMWNYHTLAQAVHETNRFIASHGRSCTTGGNGCAITVGDIATKLKSTAIGISDSSLNMTLTSQSGITKVCNPISSFQSDGTQWPPSDHYDNSPGNYTTLTAKVTVPSALVMIWYGTTGQRIDSITLKSTSSVPIVF